MKRCYGCRRRVVLPVGSHIPGGTTFVGLCILEDTFDRVKGDWHSRCALSFARGVLYLAEDSLGMEVYVDG